MLAQASAWGGCGAPRFARSLLTALRESRRARRTKEGARARTSMSSRGKKKTTMAKLNREARLRDRRAEKQTKKEARRQAAAAPPGPDLPQVHDDDVDLAERS